MAAEAAVGFAIETFGNLLIDEAKFLAGVSDQVQDLQLELDRLRSFLGDAQARAIDHTNIQVWISQSRDLAYEAEDLLEEYAFRIASQRENILKRTIYFLKECSVRHSIGSEIQVIKSKISSLTRSFQEYGINSLMEREGSSCSSQPQLRRTYSHVVEDDFIKLDNDVEMLVGHLVNENEVDLHGVVSIFGMGGSGKTSLARKVYNHDKVKGYYENIVWVCISQQWQQREILQGILIKFFTPQRDEIMKWREEELIGKLFETFRDKRCLVVLDDIWPIDAWDSIKEAFPITNKGSKLLVTRRYRSVALHVSPNGFHHEPRLLSDLESWELLQMKALRERTSIGHEERLEMEGLGKEMVKHCGGLPLAVVVLGGILATKRDIKEWKIVHSNVKAHIGRDRNVAQQQGQVAKILALSYNDLPPKLKACFLYLGQFPEDSEINVERLCQLWLAEGMISVKGQTSEESMMDVAERYLEELAERSMVRVKVDDDTLIVARFQCCRLHDLMRDLSLAKAKEEKKFSFVHSRNGFDDQAYKSSSSSNKIHRLVIHFHKEDVPKYVPPQKRISKHLRSLKLLVERNILPQWKEPQTTKFQFSWFRMLRVLEIHGLRRPNLESDCKKFFLRSIDYLGLSEGIGNLIDLRYLCLGGDLFFCLSSSLGNLKQLQTLDLRDAPNIWVPNILWKMRQLKYLYLAHDGSINFGCQKLRLDGLNKLEILENFDNRNCSCKDLVKLTNLRQLNARLIDNLEDIDEILMFISNSKKLLKVTLHTMISRLRVSRDKGSVVLIKLLSYPKLTRLSIYNMPISNLPKYEAGFALDLVNLELFNTRMEDDPTKTLERLPNLKFLTLLYWSYVGTEMQCCADGFPQLKNLRLWDLPNFEKWVIAQGAMPKLSYLSIWSCQKLQRIPDGLRFITALKELHVYGMPREFNERLQVIDGEEGEDFHKIRHVPMVKQNM